MAGGSGNRRIRKAVFPVAGLGTRFLPATKTVPKEMLPIIDRPLIQYAVDEAIEAGCDTLIFVTNRYDCETLSAVLRELVPEFQPISHRATVPVDRATVVAFPSRTARKY